MTNIEGTPHDELRVGMPVTVDFKPLDDEITIAIFRRGIVEARIGRFDAVNDHEQDWNFPFEEPLHEVFPQLHAAQNAWMAQLDSLNAPDRKTHELIRMAVTVGLRNPAACSATRSSRARSARRGRRSSGRSC